MNRIAAIGIASLLASSPLAQAQNSPALVGDYTTPSPIYQLGSAFRDVNRSVLQVNPFDALMDDLGTSYSNRFIEWIIPATPIYNVIDGEERLNLPMNVPTESRLKRALPVNGQLGGFNSFFDLDVQRSMNLTEVQRAELHKNSDWSERQLREINRVRVNNPARADDLERDYLQSYNERLNKSLTPEQLRVWRNVTGQRFEFPRPAMATR